MEKILISASSFGKADREPLNRLQEKGFTVLFNPYGRRLSEAEVKELLLEHRPAALLAGVEPLTEAVLRAASPGLKVISRIGAGLDSVDLKTAGDLGIRVTNTPDAPTLPVAELTLGLILSMLRFIHISDASIRRKEFVRPQGRLLSGKTLGIVGCGRIGSALAGLLAGFELNIIGCDPAYQLKTPHGNFREIIEQEALLNKADLVSLHLPLTGDNYHLFGEKQLRKMKKGAYLINASRGGLVDEQALYRVLKSGHLAGAALDTYEEEPYRGPLKDLDNVLLTAHIGSYTKEARIMMEQQAVDNLFDHM